MYKNLFYSNRMEKNLHRISVASGGTIKLKVSFDAWHASDNLTLKLIA